MNTEVVARIRPPSRGEISSLNVSGTRIETSSRIGHIFDAVYKPHVLTYDIYKDSFSSLVDFFIAGYNVCALVFGETNSGKSYSLAGEKTAKAGIVPLLINGVFLKLKELNKIGENRVQVNRAVEGRVTVRCLQVHNETMKDLLSPIHEERQLDLKEDPVKGIEILNITTKQVLDAAECTAVFRQAMDSVTHTQTDYGHEDTRSALIFTLDLLKVHKDMPEPYNSRLMVVKLPGAEKLAEDPTQLRMREGPTLNRSILSFQKVVSSLASSRSASRVINYSDSKLTMLLKDALGGNCKTKVLVTLKSVETPALGTVLTTAGQLAQILNYPVINDHLAQKLISQYRTVIISLQDDLKHSGLKPGDARDSKVQEMKDQLAKISNENAKLLEGREQLYRRIVELESKYTEATSSWKQLSTKLELSDEEKLQIYKNLVDLQLENNKILEEAAADKYELTNRILSLENQVSVLDNSSERDRRAAEEANRALDELRTEHKELSDEYLVLKTNHIELSNDYQQEVSKNEELGLELVHLSNIKERLQKDKEEVEIETMQEYYSQLRKLASKFSRSSLQEKNDMSRSLVSLRSENLQLEKQLFMTNSAKEGVIDTLKGEHRKELARLEDSINALKMKIKQLQASQRDSQRKLAGQSAELITSQEDKRRLEEQNDKLDQQLKEISVEYSNRLQQYIHDISVYCGQLSGQQVSLESLQAYIDTMVRKVRDAQEHRVLTLEERVSALKDSLRETTRKHGKLLSAYSVLRYDLESSKISYSQNNDEYLYQPSQEELDSVQTQEIRKLTEKIHKYEQNIKELKNELSYAKTKRENVSLATSNGIDSNQHNALDGSTEGNWSHLRKLMREFTLNTQQDLENERASLMTRCIVAEEQVVSLQEYIDTHLKRYFEEIARLRRRLGESDRVNSADAALPSSSYGRIGDKRWGR